MSEPASSTIVVSLTGASTFFGGVASALVFGCVIAWPLFKKWMGANLAKEGEIRALKENMGEVIRQLQQTTLVVEHIKVTVAHEDWALREWKLTRQQKLEELFELTRDIRLWLLTSKMMQWQGGRASEDSPFYRAGALAFLYFRELDAEFGLYRQHHFAYLTLVAEAKGQVLQNPAGKTRIEALYEPQLTDLMDEMGTLDLEIEAKIRQISDELLNKPLASRPGQG